MNLSGPKDLILPQDQLDQPDWALMLAFNLSNLPPSDSSV